MGRIEMLEIIDRPWCPQSLRNVVTESLYFFATAADNFKNIIPMLRTALLQAECRTIIDLCSGATGPWTTLVDRLGKIGDEDIHVYVTDLYPNEAAKQRCESLRSSQIKYHNEPIDARFMPADMKGFRTIFNAFHHFDPEDACKIIGDAVRNKCGIGIFEQTERRFISTLFMLTAIPLTILLMPFLRPFRWSNLFWTYIFPALPFVLAIDGIISCLRTYDQKELRNLVSAIDGSEYVWEIGQVPTPLSPLRVTFLIGYPNPDLQG